LNSFKDNYLSIIQE
ncbi:type III secretion system, LEE associated, partial [Escherichia coli EC1737]